MRRARWAWAAGAVLVLTGAALAGPGMGPVDFSRDVLPVLSDACFHCHGPDARTRKADLRLDTEDGALKANPALIVPGRSGESDLIRRLVTTDRSEVMPPPRATRKLTAAEIDLLRRWIDEGAKWGRHWALVPVARPALPAIKDAGWARNAIDRFVLARLEKEGLAPSPEAERVTLLRRVTLDLTGLPPTPVEVDAFLSDTSPGAYERVVERLLASPHYGERMAWDWLEAARYADSNGYQGDGERTMWPWRDWAVDALNRNLPYDQFTVWQLAGDLLPGGTAEQRLATGFCRNHMINGEGGRIAEENRVDYVMDMTETAGTVWLGLTLNCCRCHDHKYDPLTQKDYYQLFAFFNQTPVNGGGGDPQAAPAMEAPSREQAARLADLDGKIARAAEAVDRAEQSLFPRAAGQPAAASEKAKGVKPEVAAALGQAPARRSKEQLVALKKAYEQGDPAYAKAVDSLRREKDEREAAGRMLPRVMVMQDMDRPRDTFLLTRGSYEKPGARVGIAVPASLPPLAKEEPSNRLGLARWLVARDNPLTARVTVNRQWQQFFGTGLVKTAEDFGVQGEKPSHPELLDWLAAELVASGWDVKSLQRAIVTGAAYRQSSRVPAALAERDPANRLLARGPRFRMPSWMIRDQALAASGLLAVRLGGPPVKPYQPSGVWEEATFGGKRYEPDRGEGLYRRSLYTFWRRIVGPTMFFDASPRQVCVVKPARTNTPLQALATLNDTTYVEAARALAGRVLRTAGPTAGERVEAAFRLVLARRPTAEEREVLVAGLQRLRGQMAADPEAVKKLLAVGESPRDATLDPVEHAAYTGLASILLNTDEALTKE